MRPWALAICAACAGWTATAKAQFTTPGTPVSAPIGNSGAPTTMPVGKRVGGQVGSSANGIMQSTSQDFSNIDPSRLAAPLPVYPGIGAQPTLWNRTTQAMIAAINYMNPYYVAPVPKPPWVPGISRRNRERAQKAMWQRD